MNNAGKSRNFTNKDNRFATENSNESGYAGKLKPILRTANEETASRHFVNTLPGQMLQSPPASKSVAAEE